MSKPLISIVLPLFNEESNVEHCISALVSCCKELDEEFEFVCIDDGSSDNTARIVDDKAAECSSDTTIHLLKLSRNFGKEAAIVAGLEAARGAAVIVMDADMQHPPDIVPQMVARWRQGAHVVSAVKEDRGQEGFLHGILAGLFNTFMTQAIGCDMTGASDFKLLDRQVVDALLHCPEKTRFFRGLVAWVGFREEKLPFKVAERYAGTSKWSLWGLVRYFKNNVLAFSSLPLKLIAYIGFLTIIFGFALGLNSLQQYFRGVAISGFTTVILLQVILFGVLQTSVGIIAFYIATIYEELKGRPTYIVCRPTAEPTKNEKDEGAQT